jgi:outer membrane protein TolC
VDLPLYYGGGTKASINQARARYEEAQFQAQLVKRNAERQVKNQFALSQAAFNQLKPMTEGLTFAERSYRAQVRDYRNGLVNNLDVLASLQALYNAKLDLIHAQLSAKRLYIQLKAAVGDPL